MVHPSDFDDRIIGLLDRDTALKAVSMVRPTIEELLQEYGKRYALYTIIINPLIAYQPDMKVEDAILLETFFGTQALAEEYRPIALKKGDLSWRTGKDSHMIQTVPWLYRIGDTKYGGSTNDDGLIVSSSGVEWYFDYTCSRLLSTTCRGLVMHKYAAISKDKTKTTIII